MSISIDWGTKVIFVPKADTNLLQSFPYELRELDLDLFRLALKDLEDNVEGMPFPDTHRHNTQVSLGGLTLSRVIEIINGYTVTFENGNYGVNLVGANSNITDVLNLNSVSVRSFNSAGLIVVASGSGLSAEEHDELMSLEANLKGAGDDSLASLSEQIDAVQADLDNPDQYKADLTPVLASLGGLETSIEFLLSSVRNKKYLTKVGSAWHLVIRNSADSASILDKVLKDKDGNDITDLAAGVLARELASSV